VRRAKQSGYIMRHRGWWVLRYRERVGVGGEIKTVQRAKRLVPVDAQHKTRASVFWYQAVSLRAQPPGDSPRIEAQANTNTEAWDAVGLGVPENRCAINRQQPSQFGSRQSVVHVRDLVRHG